MGKKAPTLAAPPAEHVTCIAGWQQCSTSYFASC